MVRFNIGCSVAFPADDFWRVRDSPSFNRFIVADGMLKSISIAEPVVDEEGWTTREQTYCPNKVDCPDFIRAIIGDTMFEVKDFHRWNESVKPNHLFYRIQPSFLTSLSETKGELSLEPFPCADASSDADDDHIDHNDHNDVQKDDLKQMSEGSSSATDEDEATLHDETEQSAAKPAQHEQPSTSDVDEIESDALKDAVEAGSEIDSTENEEQEFDDTTEPTDSSDDEETSALEALANLERLPPSEKAIFRVVGQVRVRILTVGWFVERAIVHNLRLFYKDYPATVYRFRCKLYRDFANGDTSVPISEVVDRLLDWEASVAENERKQKLQEEKERELEKGHESDISQEGSDKSSSLDFLPHYLSTEKVDPRYEERPDASLLANE